MSQNTSRREHGAEPLEDRGMPSFWSGDVNGAAVRTSGSVHELHEEHPELYRAAVVMIRHLRSVNSALASVDGASVWMQHMEFAERTAALASHLEAAIKLAASGHIASAIAVMRVGLEHQCLDELLMPADRYREDRKVDDATFEAWRAEYEARQEEWTETVVSFDRSKKYTRWHRFRDDARLGHARAWLAKHAYRSTR